MPDWYETTIFDHGAGPEPHARLTDPVSSELTLQSLGKDTSYNWRIFDAIVRSSRREELRVSSDGEGIAVIHDVPVTDDMILDYMERRHMRRYQRNVIARQRGIIRELGWIQRVDDQEGPTGRPVVAHIPTHEGMQIWTSR